MYYIHVSIETIHEPYIKLRLSSVCKASDKHWKTKPVKGMQKAPLFNEEINLYVYCCVGVIIES